MKAGVLPFISIIIPVRNERAYIGACLDSILVGSYPLELMEILVVDGSSDDGTREAVLSYAARYPCIQLLDNPARAVPHAMNIGIRAARGDPVVRVDAHAHYGPGYLQQLVTSLRELEADNVGGVVLTRPASAAPEARAVSTILSHPFGVGNSQFRLARLTAPAEVDTVPFGCYRRDVFDRIGYYDEFFIRNQDDELNARLRQAGGRIFLVPQIQVEYVARDSLRKLARMLYQYGYFKPLIAIKLGRPATLRQLGPPLFVLALVLLPFIALAVPYAWAVWATVFLAHLAVNLTVSAQEALRQGWRLSGFLLCGFLIAHLAYGWGYLIGTFDFGIRRRHLRGGRSDMALSR